MYTQVTKTVTSFTKNIVVCLKGKVDALLGLYRVDSLFGLLSRCINLPAEYIDLPAECTV